MEPLNPPSNSNPLSDSSRQELNEVFNDTGIAPWKKISEWLILAIEGGVITLAAAKIIAISIGPCKKVLHFLSKFEAPALLGLTTGILRMVQKWQEIRRRSGDPTMFKMWYLEAFSMGIGAIVGGALGSQAAQGAGHVLQAAGSIVSHALMGMAVGYLIYKGIESLRARKEKDMKNYVKNFFRDLSNAIVLDFGFVNFDEGNDFSLFLVQMGEEAVPDYVVAQKEDYIK